MAFACKIRIAFRKEANMKKNNTFSITSIFLFFVGLIIIGFLLGSNITDATWLNPNIAQAEAERTIAETSRQQAILNQQLANAKTEVEIQVLQLELQSLEEEKANNLKAFFVLTKQGETYVSEDNEVWSSGTILLTSNELAAAILVFPQKIRLGDSNIVSLSLIPSNLFNSSSARSTEAVNSNILVAPFQLTDKIQIYPIMHAKLSGVGFDISSSTENEQTVSIDEITEWLWTIKPKETGKHVLVIDIAVPGIVGGKQQQLDANVNLFPIEILVEKSLSDQIQGILPYILPATIGLIGVIIGLFVNRYKRIEDIKTKTKNKNTKQRQRLKR